MLRFAGANTHRQRGGKMCECYPCSGDLLSADVIPHLMGSNFRTGEEDFSADSRVWECVTWWDFPPTPTPCFSQEGIMELLGCRKAQTLFPNGSFCCLVTACQVRCQEMPRSVGLEVGI